MWFESLELRRLLSVAVDAGLVGIMGTDDADNIGITRNETHLIVHLNGASTSIPLRGLRGIRVDAKAGHDAVRVAQDVRLPTTLLGGSGNDSIFGGGGHDQIDGGEGADAMHGGGGVDAVTYARRERPVHVILDGLPNDGTPALPAPTANVEVVGEGDNVHPDIERVFGGAGNDLISAIPLITPAASEVGPTTAPVGRVFDGGAGDDLLIGGRGPDLLRGGPGFDTVSYEHRTEGVHVSLDGRPNDGFLILPPATTAVAAVSLATGEARGDARFEEGAGGGDELATRPGPRPRPISEGDNVLPDVERVLGGRGDDHLVGIFRNTPAPTSANTAAGPLVHLIGGPGNDRLVAGTLPSLLAGGDGNDQLQGSPAPDRLDGGDGDDRIFGGGGRDGIFGGAGNDFIVARDGVIDLINGGDGDDSAVIDADDDVSNVENILP